LCKPISNKQLLLSRNVGKSGRGRGRNSLPSEDPPAEEAAADLKSTAAKGSAGRSARARGRNPDPTEEPPTEALAVDRTLKPLIEEGLDSKGSLQAPRNQNSKDFASALR
jgi:hypothetical protein